MKSDGKESAIFLDKKTTTVNARAKSGLLLNTGRTGFYTVLYDKAGYERLADAFPTLDPMDRAGLMNDLFLFLEAGLVEPELYLRFVSLCGGIFDSVTTETVAGQLFLLTSIAWDSPRLQKVYPSFYPPLIEKIGEDRRPDEPEYVGAARETLTSMYAEVDSRYAAKLAAKFDHYTDLDPNLKGAVAVGYALTKGERAKKPLMEMVKTLQGEVDREKIYLALCSFHDPATVEETLELGLSGEVSRSDSAYPLLYSAFNPYVRETYWKWLTKRYDKMNEMYAGSQQFYLYLSRIIPVCGVNDVAKVKQFISGRRLKEGGSSYTRALEHLEVNSRLRRRFLEPARHSRN
jgi:aminopeptidase N